MTLATAPTKPPVDGKPCGSTTLDSTAPGVTGAGGEPLLEEGQLRGALSGGGEGVLRSALTLVNGIHFPTPCGFLLRAI